MAERLGDGPIEAAYLGAGVRALVIGADELTAIAALRARAVSNVVDAAAAVVAQDPESVRERNRGQTIELPRGFSVTYTIERQPSGLHAHLSVSIDAPRKGPNPAAVDMILAAFGMQPLAESHAWKEDLSPTLFAVNVLQPLTEEVGSA